MINIKNLSKNYFDKNNSKDIVCLSNINFECSTYGITFINGISGSGKTTLLNIISGKELPTKGTVEKARTSYITKENNLIDTLNVFDNLKLTMDESIIENGKNVILSLLDEFELSKISTKYPKELSNYEIKVVALVRSLLENNDVILIDNPSFYLSDTEVKSYLELITKYKNNHLFIIADDKADVIKKYADRILYLDHGNIINEDKIVDNNTAKIDNPRHSKYRINNIDNFFKLSSITSKKNVVSLVFFSIFMCLLIIAMSFFSSYAMYSKTDIIKKNISDSELVNIISIEDKAGKPIQRHNIQPLIDNNEGINYIINGKLNKPSDLNEFGFELYPNAKELNNNNIYIYEVYFKSNINNTKVFYDKEGLSFVQSEDDLDYSNLPTLYLRYLDYKNDPCYVEIAGVVKKVDDKYTDAGFYYDILFTKTQIFSLAGSSYDKNTKNQFSEIDFYDKDMSCSLNNKQILNEKVVFNNVQNLRNEFDYTKSYLVTKFDIINNDLKHGYLYLAEDEVFISLSLYNFLFNTSIMPNDIVDSNNEIRNRLDNISNKFTFELYQKGHDYKITKELIIKGVYISNDYYFHNVITFDNQLNSKIIDDFSNVDFFVSRNSIEKPNKFVSMVNDRNLTTNFNGTYVIDKSYDSLKETNLITNTVFYSLLAVTIIYLVVFVICNVYRNRKNLYTLNNSGFNNTISSLATIFVPIIIFIVICLCMFPLAVALIKIINLQELQYSFLEGAGSKFTTIYFKPLYMSLIILGLIIIGIITSFISVHCCTKSFKQRNYK